MLNSLNNEEDFGHGKKKYSEIIVRTSHSKQQWIQVAAISKLKYFTKNTAPVRYAFICMKEGAGQREKWKGKQVNGNISVEKCQMPSSYVRKMTPPNPQ